MKTYPARFVGEFDDRDIFKAVPNVGDVAILRGRNYPDGWTLTARDPVNVEPSVLVRYGDVSRCHYFVHGGQLQMLDDTTSRLR